MDCLPLDLFQRYVYESYIVVCIVRNITCLVFEHSQITKVAADCLVPVWHQGICSHHQYCNAIIWYRVFPSLISTSSCIIFANDLSSNLLSSRSWFQFKSRIPFQLIQVRGSFIFHRRNYDFEESVLISNIISVKKHNIFAHILYEAYFIWLVPCRASMKAVTSIMVSWREFTGDYLLPVDSHHINSLSKLLGAPWRSCDVSVIDDFPNKAKSTEWAIPIRYGAIHFGLCSISSVLYDSVAPILTFQCIWFVDYYSIKI